MARAAREHAIPLNILYSVALTESGRAGDLHPFDIDSDGRFIQADTLQAALANVATEQARGARFIDVGCMQINIRFHAAHFHSIQEMFDPAANVSYAAALLKRLKSQQGSWTLAVARYNAGPNNDAAQKRYVCAVVAHMVRSGMGAWTPAAEQFCNLSNDK